jgi:hypothetical protein
MKSLRLFLVSLTLFLAACSSAEPATPTATVAPATIAPTATIQLPTPLPTVTDGVVLLDQSPLPTSATADTATVATTPATTPIATVASTPAPASSLNQGDGYEELSSPVALLASYFDAINQQDYERAYSYWTAAPLDYASFAAGYGDTASVRLIVQPPTRIEGAAGTLYVEIPTVLIAQHNDGSTHTFAGCIVTRKSNLQPPAVPEEDVWHIYQARLEEVANNASIPNLLADGCTI